MCTKKSRATCVVVVSKNNICSVYERGRVHTRFQIGVVLGAGSYVCIYRTHSLPYSEYSHSVRYIYIFTIIYGVGRITVCLVLICCYNNNNGMYTIGGNKKQRVMTMKGRATTMYRSIDRTRQASNRVKPDASSE